MKVVIDCSVVMSWFFEDEQEPSATALLQSMPDVQAIVPALWPLEVANVLALSERRGRVTPSEATKFLLLLAELPIQVDAHTVENAFGTVLQVARSFEMTAYDAAYLELAIRQRIPLATLDSRLKTAAKRAAVTIWSSANVD